MTTIPDEWQLDSGLREEYLLTVEVARFGYDVNYQDGKTLLLIIDGTDENGETTHENLSCGSDWTTVDGGLTATHPTKKRFNASSIYGRWIAASLEIPALAETIIKRGLPTTAAIWNDLVIQLRAVELNFGKNIDKRTRLLPAEFIGVYDSASNSVITPTGAPAVQQPTLANPPPAASTPATQLQVPNASANVAAPTVDPMERVRLAKEARQNPAAVSPLVEHLIMLAKASPTHDDFLSQALQSDDLLADDELTAHVADPNGFYAQHHG